VNKEHAIVRIITANAPNVQIRKAQTAAQKAAQTELDDVRAADVARRKETRRKVVIGAALIARAERNPNAAKMLAELKSSLTRPADKKLFKDEPDG
jgi:hypothetical protein